MRIHSRTARVAGLCAVALIALPALAGAQAYVKNNNFGVGVANPTFPVHVVKTTAGSQVMINVENNGAPLVNYKDTSLNVSWLLSPLSNGDFTISKGGTGGPELLIQQSGLVRMGPGPSSVFTLTPSGNLIIAGSLTQGSSRQIKQGIVPLDGQQILERVADLGVHEWSYKAQTSRHVGPMAEDFYAAFGLGAGDEGLAPADVAGVTLAALQGLNEVVQEKNAEIERLSRELAELQAVVAALLER